MADEPFNPDWCLAPSATLEGWLAEHNVTPGELAARAGGGQWPASVHAALRIRDVLTQQPLTSDHTGILEAGTGIPAHFWVNHERIYRTGLAAGKTDTTHHVAYPAGHTSLDQIITWGACPRCLAAYETRTTWQAGTGASVLTRCCPICGNSPDSQPPS